LESSPEILAAPTSELICRPIFLFRSARRAACRLALRAWPTSRDRRRRYRRRARSLFSFPLFSTFFFSLFFSLSFSFSLSPSSFFPPSLSLPPPERRTAALHGPGSRATPPLPSRAHTRPYARPPAPTRAPRACTTCRITRRATRRLQRTPAARARSPCRLPLAPRPRRSRRTVPAPRARTRAEPSCRSGFAIRAAAS
jgi:hypothetical protein